MKPQLALVAKECLDASEANSLAFPQIVAKLAASGFESYLIDFRRATATYYLPDGESVVHALHAATAPVAAVFDTAGLVSAIREAQTLAPSYTYRGFCAKAQAAGCAGYMVSFLGKRAVYFARNGETHVENFPGPR